MQEILIQNQFHTISIECNLYQIAQGMCLLLIYIILIWGCEMLDNPNVGLYHFLN